MTWVTIPNSVFESGKPARAIDMRNLRDNLEAMAAGASGAPKISKLALGGLLLGGFAASGASNYGGLTGLGSVEEVFFIWYGTESYSTTASTSITIRFTNNGGSTWGADQTLISKSGSTQLVKNGHGAANVNLVTGAKTAVGAIMNAGVSGVLDTNALTVPANCDGFQLKGGTAIPGFSAICFGVKGR